MGKLQKETIKNNVFHDKHAKKPAFEIGDYIKVHNK